MVIGHEHVLKFLRKSIENKRLAHAYLFTGPAHLGKKKVAFEFVKMLTGQEITDDKIQPDILIIEPEIIEKDNLKKELEIGIDQARRIQHQMSLSTFSASCKIALIDQAERMTDEAANCLLKILEEPPGQAIFILITSQPQKLLDTIISRCQSVKFLLVPEKEIHRNLSSLANFKKDNLGKAVRLANGRPGLALEYLEKPDLLKEQDKIISQLENLLKADLNDRYQYAEIIAKDIPRARQILNYWLFWFRDLLLLSNGCSDLVIYPGAIKYKNSYSLNKLKEIIQKIKKSDQLLANPSINARLVLEVLMLEI